ncbi:MAG TPA: M24 family metallopeptidase [Kiritimatiellia bacterium]|nr:M24 family metallopeptidase [Kiritimatiellia bacterium]
MKKSSTARLIVAGEGDADLRYAGRFQPVDPVVYLDHPRGAHLVVPMLEVGRAKQEAKHARVWTPGDLDLPPMDRRSIAAWTVALARRTRTRAVQVTGAFPVEVARALERARVRVDIAQGPLYPERIKKTSKEIALIRIAQEAAVAAVRAAVRDIRGAHINRAGELIAGRKVLTSERVKHTINRVLLERECQAEQTIVACGRHAADPHHRGEGPLGAGQTIVLDIFPRHLPGGYWGDITRTVVKGPASPELKRMYLAVLRTQAWARAQIRPGIRADLLHQQVQQRLAAAGYATETRDGIPVGFFHGTGHGVGLDIHEAPSISLAAVRLQAGQVVTVEPGLYYPELGGIRVEDTVVVTPRGAEVLCPCPYYFEL